MTHTPGPWQIRELDRSVRIFAPELNNGEICSIKLSPYLENWQRHANARLIAAAPDLLEALTKIVNEIKKYHHGFDANLFVAAERIVAKATGSAS